MAGGPELARVTQVQRVELILGVIFADPDQLGPLEQELETRFSAIEARSAIFDFEATDYYEDEMGRGLKRIFYSFSDLIDPAGIVDIKIDTNRIEDDLARDGRRRVNIDPGYMDSHKLVLASAKFQGQKIYLGKGVYADPTLYYDKGWKPYDWGFPDFKSGRYDEFLTGVRRSYRNKLRNVRGRDGKDQY
jgi:hypothetical protein